MTLFRKILENQFYFTFHESTLTEKFIVFANFRTAPLVHKGKMFFVAVFRFLYGKYS